MLWAGFYLFPSGTDIEKVFPMSKGPDKNHHPY